MPRRTSLDATTWNKQSSMVPSLWEICVNVLTESSTNCQKIVNLSIEERKVLAQQIISRKKITRESLELLSTCKDISACAHLDFSNSDITDYGLYILSGITSLIRLNLHNCKNITNRGLYYLKYLKNLQQLDISKCKQITDEGLPYLSYLTELRKLEVNDIHGGLGRGLCTAAQRMQKLTYLSMDRSKFDAKYLRFLQTLPSLQTLSFKDSKAIQDECIVTLTCFPSLVELDVSGNLLTSRGINILQSIFMGRDDVSEVRLRAPALFLLSKRQENSSTPLHTEKQLRQIDTLFSSKQLVKYITGITAASSDDITRSLRKLALRETQEQESFKESSPMVRKHSITQSLPNGTSISRVGYEDEDAATESESDSDEILILLSDEEDEDEIEIEIESESEQETEPNDASLFAFNETDPVLSKVVIKIAEIPAEVISRNSAACCNSTYVRKTKETNLSKESSSVRGKENKKNPAPAKSNSTTSKPKSRRTRSVAPKPVQNNDVVSQPKKAKRKISLSRQFANLTIESASTGRTTRSRSRSVSCAGK